MEHRGARNRTRAPLNWCLRRAALPCGITFARRFRRMKIALFPSAFHPNLGGVEELTRQLAHALARRGHRVVVVTQRWPRDLPAYEEFEGLPVHRVAFVAAPQGLDLRALKARALWNKRRREAEIETARIVRESDAELVHIQCAGPNAYYAHHAARALKLPLVLSAQGELTMDAAGLYQKSGWMRGVLREILGDAARVTACSRNALDDVENFAAPIALLPRASVIYNGISLADFAAVPNAHQPHRPYVFAMGRFVPQKGFDVLLQAWKRADLRDFDLILAGDGPEKAALQTLARDCDNVHFWGRADRADVVRLLCGCAWFVLPSRVEPQGIVNLEAMAAGRAVVASRTGGVPEIVLDGQTGVLVPPGHVEALASALREMAADAPRRAALGAAGLQRAQAFDWDAIAAQYEAVYREALGN